MKVQAVSRATTLFEHGFGIIRLNWAASLCFIAMKACGQTESLSQKFLFRLEQPEICDLEIPCNDTVIQKPSNGCEVNRTYSRVTLIMSTCSGDPGYGYLPCAFSTPYKCDSTNRRQNASNGFGYGIGQVRSHCISNCRRPHQRSRGIRITPCTTLKFQPLMRRSLAAQTMPPGVDSNGQQGGKLSRHTKIFPLIPKFFPTYPRPPQIADNALSAIAYGGVTQQDFHK